MSNGQPKVLNRPAASKSQILYNSSHRMILQDIGSELEAMHLVYGDTLLEPLEEEDEQEMPEEDRNKLLKWLKDMDDKLVDAPQCQLRSGGNVPRQVQQ